MIYMIRTLNKTYNEHFIAEKCIFLWCIAYINICDLNFNAAYDYVF